MKPDEMEMLARALGGESAESIIEDQEARGQQQMARASVLPKDGSGGEHRAKLTAMGIQFHGDADDLFVNVTLPEGWQVRPTGHSMHSDLVDERGHVRAAIFYKAAFYDRAAHIHIRQRFTTRWEPICGYGEHFFINCEVRVHRAYDEERPIWQSEPIQFATRQDRWAYENTIRNDDPATEWLAAHYPEWDDVLAYWELPAVEPVTTITWKEEA